MTPVDSSNIAAIGYEPATETMCVQFKNGAAYIYLDVKPEVYQEFLDSESKGKFLAQTIKGKYESEKIQ
jgi:hypothetical protein